MSRVDLVTAAEIARRLQMPPGQLRRLIGGSEPGFPEPHGRLGRVDVWDWRAIAAWAGRGSEGAVPAPDPSSVDTAGADRLPASADSFIGRRGQLLDLEQALGQHRLVVLTGPPGVGKTRLARELVATSARSHRDGIHFVELAALTDPALVASTVASTLGIWGQSGLPVSRALRSHLRRRQLLLVLDNCEHLLEAVAELTDGLLAGCPELTVLATSQAQLGIAGELAWPVPPLALPDEDASPELLAAAEAVALFASRAAGTRPGFALGGDVVRTVARICRRLDGIPLAIELAAARTAVLTPAEIDARLDDRFTLLTGGGSAVLPRHQTLRLAVDWSYNLLSAPEHTLLRRLSVFLRGCALQAVESVCEEPGSGPGVLASLAGLVAKSLVIADTSRDRARYTLLESIRLHAAERLREAGEEAWLRGRHASWSVDFAEEAAERLCGAEQVDWLRRVEAEHDNLRSALSWAIGERRPELALRLSAALTLFWRIRGHFREGRGWLEAALGLPGEQPNIHRARALWGLGFMALMLDDATTPPRVLDEALHLARVAGDVRTEGRSLFLLGNYWIYHDRSRGLELLGRAATSARQSGDSWCLAHSLAFSSRALVQDGAAAAAAPQLEECLAVARSAHDEQSLRIALLLAGDAALSRGDLPAAEALLREGLESARRLGEPFSVARALSFLAEVALQRGEYDRAEQLLAESLPMAGDAGSPVVAGVLCLLGRVSLARDDLDTAGAHFDQALAEADQYGARFGPALEGLGEVALVRGLRERARRLLDEALLLAPEDHSKQERASVLASLGDLASAEGDLRRSVSMHRSALELRQRIGHLPGVAVSLDALASRAVDTGQLDRAVRLFSSAEALRRACGFASHPRQRLELRDRLRTCRQGLGAEPYRGAWEEGAALTAQSAISYALKGSGPRARSVTGWASLTRSERDVVALVSEGFTNVEIGQRLFISPRTVETHLTHVFAKLGISSRRQLRREAAQGAV